MANEVIQPLHPLKTKEAAHWAAFFFCLLFLPSFFALLLSLFFAD
tara:strand:+ start:1290 stop:1424 length:135 start_codon:yes stop_codon:yes gene_type:complete